jgi:HEAT repeat protein
VTGLGVGALVAEGARTASSTAFPASPEAVPALAIALNDEEPLIRGHAAWALGRIGTEAARRALRGREEAEGDAWVISEIKPSLDED